MLTKLKTKHTKTHADENADQWKIQIAGGSINWYSHFEKQFGNFSKYSTQHLPLKFYLLESSCEVCKHVHIQICVRVTAATLCPRGKVQKMHWVAKVARRKMVFILVGSQGCGISPRISFFHPPVGQGYWVLCPCTGSISGYILPERGQCLAGGLGTTASMVAVPAWWKRLHTQFAGQFLELDLIHCGLFDAQIVHLLRAKKSKWKGRNWQAC